MISINQNTASCSQNMQEKMYSSWRQKDISDLAVNKTEAAKT